MALIYGFRFSVVSFAHIELKIQFGMDVSLSCTPVDSFMFEVIKGEPKSPEWPLDIGPERTPGTKMVPSSP
jgi:hypothetical protein